MLPFFLSLKYIFVSAVDKDCSRIQSLSADVRVGLTRRHMRIAPPSAFPVANFSELWEYRDVLLMLLVRDLKLRYRQTAVGLLWVVLQPLVAGLIFTLIFGRFVRLSSDGGPYLTFVLSGLLVWQLFAGTVQRGAMSLINDARLIEKVYFPRLILPLSALLAVFADFCISMFFLFAVELAAGVPLYQNLVFLPVSIVLCLMMGLGVSLWFASLNVKYRDFGHTLPFILQIWMYGSPIIYSINVVPIKWKHVFDLNPIVTIIGLFRHAILGSPLPGGLAIATCIVVSLMFLVSGWVIFSRIEAGIADSL